MFPGCENFLKDSELLQELEFSIDYANAKTCRVYIRADSAEGSFLGSEEREIKVGFSTDVESVSINRAKNQMLSLNIPKLSGHCGKLICCLLYEDDAYTDLKKDFPPLGTLFERDDGKVWKVTSYNVFSRHVKMVCENDYEFVPLEDALKLKKVVRNK